MLQADLMLPAHTHTKNPNVSSTSNATCMTNNHQCCQIYCYLHTKHQRCQQTECYLCIKQTPMLPAHLTLPAHHAVTNVASKFNTTSTPVLPANLTLPPHQTQMLPADLAVLANLNTGSRSYTPAVKSHGNKPNTFNKQ